MTEAILTRRSVRVGFITKPIPGEILDEILRCGLAAPSSKGEQPWRFHVVAANSMRNQIADDVVSADAVEEYVPHDPLTGERWPQYVSTVIESAEVLRACSAAIFIENRGVFGRQRGTLATIPTAKLVASLVGIGLEWIGIGAAIENMFVAAHALGVGGTFMGDVVIAEVAIRERLSLEGDLVGVLTLGFSETTEHRGIPDVDDRLHVVWHGERG